MSFDPTPADRRDVIAVLRTHGLSGAAAASLWTIGRGLVRDTRRRDREHSAMVDMESGSEVGPRMSGEAHQVDILAQLVAARPGREYCHLHTHPSNGAFSAADARVQLSNLQLRTIVAVGIDGRWHIMSQAANGESADPWAVSDVFGLELRRLLDDESIPMVEAPHIVWSTISGSLGLRYSRIEGRPS